MPFNEALIFGFIVSLSSTAIVMKILQEKGEVDTLQGRTLLGILIFQDLAIIPMMLIAPLLVGSRGPDLNALPLQVGKVALILLIIIIMARWVIPCVSLPGSPGEEPRALPDHPCRTCVLIAWLTSEAGLSFTLGAFIAGLIIGESDYNIDALGHIIPFRDVFASIFFLSIGMLLNTRTVLVDFYYVAMIVFVIIAVKILTGRYRRTPCSGCLPGLCLYRAGPLPDRGVLVCPCKERARNCTYTGRGLPGLPCRCDHHHGPDPVCHERSATGS